MDNEPAAKNDEQLVEPLLAAPPELFETRITAALDECKAAVLRAFEETRYLGGNQ